MCIVVCMYTYLSMCIYRYNEHIDITSIYQIIHTFYPYMQMYKYIQIETCKNYFYELITLSSL